MICARERILLRSDNQNIRIMVLDDRFTFKKFITLWCFVLKQYCFFINQKIFCNKRAVDQWIYKCIVYIPGTGSSFFFFTPEDKLKPAEFRFLIVNLWSLESQLLCKESPLFVGDQCLWLSWVTSAHEFTSPWTYMYIVAFV